MCGGGTRHLIYLIKRQEKRTEIGVPIGAIILISVGELSVRKNHRVVVEALQKLMDDYYYVIVGKGDLKNELESIDKTGRLKLLGYRTDIVDLLHASDLFVFPSLQEGLPVAMMEAMAAGLPAVCSRIRGNVDLIKNGKGGYLYECHDAYGFAEGIKKAYKNKKIGLENLETIKRYDIDNVNKEMKRIYCSHY